MVDFFKEIYHFSWFQRGSNIFQVGGVQLFPRGSNCSFSIETHITCDFPGGGGWSGPPVPPSGSALAVWYPNTTTDINKVEAVQRRAARWATRDYRYTSSVTAMLKDLNWCPLDQRRIDSRLMMMYKVTYHLEAIPASLYHVPNTRVSRHIPSLAYRQIQTLKDYYRCQVHILSQNYHPLECPPCQHTYPSHTGTV